MNLPELQKQIIDNQLSNLYIFGGLESYVQKIYITKIARLKNLEISYVDDYKSIISSIRNKNLFDVKKLYVIINDNDILKQEEVWQDLKETNGNVVIFKYYELDKRGKFYKYFEADIVEFIKLSNEVLVKYMKKQMPNLLEVNCEKLIYICDNDYDRILMELDKISNYAKVTGWVDDIAFLHLDKSGAFHKETGDIIFEFIDSIVRRDYQLVADLSLKFRASGDSILGLITLLYNNLKTILLIKSCKSNDIAKTTGLKSNQIYYNQDKINYYSIGELVRALKILQKVEISIKQGTLEESIALDYIITNII